MIVALELCEEIVVYGMVSDRYCRSAGVHARGGAPPSCGDAAGPVAKGTGLLDSEGVARHPTFV